MASTTAICSSFKTDLMVGIHDFTNSTGHAFYWALYTSTATNGAATTAYSATNEISGTNYVAKGTTGANTTPTLDSTTAYTDWPDPTWSSASFTAASTLLYNDTVTTPTADPSVAVWDFGGDQTASGGDFVLQLPTPNGTTGILRLA